MWGCLALDRLQLRCQVRGRATSARLKELGSRWPEMDSELPGRPHLAPPYTLPNTTVRGDGWSPSLACVCVAVLRASGGRPPSLGWRGQVEVPRFARADLSETLRQALSGGSLGSCVDEERSQLRYLM